MAEMLVFVAAVAMRPALADPLLQGFQNPPASARPHTWWHWMNGNVTKAGITADLEAMKEVGIGGAQMFTVDQGIPAGKAGYNGPRWREMTEFAIEEANRLGIELCIHNCAGWSSSGGPWITPANSMQVLAWSTQEVAGGTVDIRLDPIKAPQVVAEVPYSTDIAVYAYPADAPQDPIKNRLGETGVVRQDGLQPSLRAGAGVTAIDLTDQFHDGRLRCTLPAGRWTVLRLGHVSTGKDNHPAPPEGDGLEVDKLSRSALDTHWEGMMAKVIATAGPLAGKSLNNSLIDSYEVGSQNWTPKMFADFKRLRGYDARPLMPALAGVIVGSRPITERFLWDYRRTIADLYAENYFGYFGELCHRNGLKFSTEPYGNGGFDTIQAGGTADIPMGEFWLGGGAMESTKLASSIGHTYGRPVIGAESFTADDVRGRFLEEPYMMKTVGDLAYVNGINRYIFHRYAMQPWTKFAPGMTMGPWGTHLERTQTWWTEARSFMQYAARCQDLLQKGRFVADAVVFEGESAPVDLAYGRGGSRIVPEGYDYDGCDTKTLLAMTVKGGRLTLPSGMSYRILVLPKTEFMTAPVARKIRSLVSDGAVMVGPKPTHSPSLTNFPECETEVARIGNEVWGDGPSHPYGHGLVYPSAKPADVLRALEIAPDFVAKGAGLKVLDIHRRINGSDVYFVSNQKYQPAIADCTFRVEGLQPELWHPETGQTELAPVWKGVKGGTQVSLRLNPAESVFVVFRTPATMPHLTGLDTAAATPIRTEPITIVLARYGSADGRGEDVTAQVREMARNGETEIAATNDNFGDPVVNVVKQLTIDYKEGSKPRHIVIPENETWSVASTAPSASVDDYDVSIDDAGRTWFLPWKKGEWTLDFMNRRRRVIKEAGNTTDLSSGWTVSFAPNLGAPAEPVGLKTLIPWNQSPVEGIRFFSGSAIYRKQFSWVRGRESVRLDLGSVKNFATVTLNGKPFPTLWKPPFVLDVTSALRDGTNRLEIRVTNLWVNRLIGDAHLPEDAEWNGNHLAKWPDWLLNDQPRPKTGRITFTTWKFWDKNSPLLDSGLIGPVRLETALPLLLK